jgi:hypothetical protein
LADAEHATAYRSIGRMMAAIMYCEAKFKNSRDGITRHRVLWDIAHEN